MRPQTASAFPAGIVRRSEARERAAWRNLAEWRVRAKVAIDVLESVLKHPESALQPCEHLYSDAFRAAFVAACKEEIERLRRAMDDNRLLASIYGRAVPPSKGGHVR
jgi:hypothetical protein